MSIKLLLTLAVFNKILTCIFNNLKAPLQPVLRAPYGQKVVKTQQNSARHVRGPPRFSCTQAATRARRSPPPKNVHAKYFLRARTVCLRAAKLQVRSTMRSRDFCVSRKGIVYYSSGLRQKKIVAGLVR